MNGNIIVTGANGFVGGAVVSELASRGYIVYAVIRENGELDDKLKVLDNVVAVQCNMDNYEKLGQLVPKIDFLYFFHFAWEGCAGILRQDEVVQLNNVRNSCQAIKTAKNLGCRRFIMPGSIVEYEVESIKQDKQKFIPSLIYSIAKKTSDYMCRALADSLGIQYVCGLISNIYGPGEKSVRLVNNSIRKLLNNEHVSFTDGKQMYDFIYITDAAEAFVVMAEKGKNGQEYYLGSKKPRQLCEYLLEMGEIVAPKNGLGFGEIESKYKGLSYREFDISLLTADTGFEPKISFSEGIRKTMEYILSER